MGVTLSSSNSKHHQLDKGVAKVSGVPIKNGELCQNIDKNY